MRALGREYSGGSGGVRRGYDLDSMVEEISRHVPRMLAAYPTEGEFWNWFSGEVESVRRNARSHEERDRLTEQLMQALTRAGCKFDPIPFDPVARLS